MASGGVETRSSGSTSRFECVSALNYIFIYSFRHGIINDNIVYCSVFVTTILKIAFNSKSLIMRMRLPLL